MEKTHHREQQEQHAAPVEAHGGVEGTDNVEIHFVGDEGRLFHTFYHELYTDVYSWEDTYEKWAPKRRFSIVRNR